MNLTRIRKLGCPSLKPLQFQSVSAYFYSTEAEKIEIPKRINRGPTDILRALESTITRDVTAAHYKYHDDPYLIPMSNRAKRVYAMAQESGRKAAHWIREQHSDLFQHKEMDPIIKSFVPKISYNENSEVDVEDLAKAIDDVQVSDAILIYKLLKQKNIELSKELEVSLLELLCYTNAEDVISEEYIEERWFRQSSSSKEKQRKTWKDGNFAEELFIGMENPTDRVYSAMIQGMAKHFQVDRAWQLYEESLQKNIVLNADTHNALITVVNFLKEDYNMRWELVLNLLSNMNKAKIKPNLATLNAVLQSLSTMGGGRNAKENALATLSEFKSLGIEPSLASYYYLLITFCKERGPVSSILNDIMPFIENKEHQIRDIRDTYFFVTAMDVCRNHLRDLELAQRVHKLVHFGNNYNLLGDSYKESIYFRHYFILCCHNMPLEEFMESIYNKYVPHIYVPEPSVMAEVLNQVELNAAVEHVPKLWSDMVVFDHVSRENLVEQVLSIMNNTPVEDSLAKSYSDIAWNLYERIENQNEERFGQLKFTGEMLGKIMYLLLKNKDFEKGCTIMEKLDKGHNKIVGVPKFEALNLFVEACIENKSPSKAINCIQYCSDIGYQEAADLAKKLQNSLTLDENHLAELNKIL